MKPISYLIFIFLYQSHLFALTWDDSYKTIAAAHAASCCSTCTPQYCTYVYCNDDTTDSSPIITTPNDQCLCTGHQGIKYYAKGDYVAVGSFPAGSVSTDCIKGIYSSGVAGSTAYVAPTSYDYVFDITCLNDQDVAETSVGLGIGAFYCSIPGITSTIRRYNYVEVGTPSANYYNQVYYCKNLTKDFGWKLPGTAQDGAKCGGNQLGYASIDYKGYIASAAGGEYTATPTFTATTTPTVIPTTATPTVTVTATNTATNTNTPTNTNTNTPTNTPTAGCTTEDGVASGNHNIFIAHCVAASCADTADHYITTHGKSIATFDNICRLAAIQGGLTKRYAALVASDRGDGAKARFENIAGFSSTGRYSNFADDLAEDWTTLWNSSPLTNKLSSDESNSSYPSTYVISGSKPDGSVQDNCSNWSDSSASANFTYGDNAAEADWINVTTMRCDNNPSDQTVYCLSLVPACTVDPAATATPTATNTPTITNTATNTATATNTPAGCTTEDGVASGNHNIFVVTGNISGTPVGTVLKAIVTNSAQPAGRHGYGYDNFSYICEQKAAEGGFTKAYVPVVANNASNGAKAAVEAHSAWNSSGEFYNSTIQVAGSWADLWDGTLINVIRKDQAGSNAGVYPITGSHWSGTFQNNCNGWTNATAGYGYTIGDSADSGTGAFRSSAPNCDTSPSGDSTLLSLYCISLKPACTADAAATSTPTATPTAVATNTATNTPTNTATNAATNTATNTPTNTRTPTASPTPTHCPYGDPTCLAGTTATPTPTVAACVYNPAACTPMCSGPVKTCCESNGNFGCTGGT